jgi:hypothetical protein
MRLNKGMSVISLIITIIVMIIIVSITAYEGIKSIDSSRKLLATERLRSVATAILSHEDLLKYTEKLDAIEGEYTQITTNDYYLMGLDDFADTSEFPPILIKKEYDKDDPAKKIYTLRTPKLLKKTGIYNDDEYVEYIQEFYEERTTEHYKVEFDKVKGVNRPLITKEMMPVKTFFTGNNDYLPVLVDDMYTEEWYSYSKESPMWANAMIRNTNTNRQDVYVWIPRFAYRIQDIYTLKGYDTVPASAIEIVFLQGTTDLMPNGDLLPAKFQVHPAFKYRDPDTNEMVNLPGFWVAKRNIDYADDLLSNDALMACIECKIDKFYSDVDRHYISMHLMKNTEWAAVAYLSQATCGQVTNGNSLDISASGVLDLNEPCFVAGGLAHDVDHLFPYGDKYYEAEDTYITYDSYEGYSGDNYGHSKGKKFGDAIIATSSGLDEKSAWFGGTSIRVSEEEPYIIRGLDSNLFSYDACSSSSEGAKFRNVIIVNER